MQIKNVCTNGLASEHLRCVEGCINGHFTKRVARMCIRSVSETLLEVYRKK